MTTQALASASPPIGRTFGPPGVFAAVSAGLFVAGLLASIAVAGGAVFPSPFSDPAAALAYFTDHADAVRIGATLQFASVIPASLFLALTVLRLRQLGTLALIGGVLANAALLMSAVMTWVLTMPATVENPALVRAVHTLAFLAGGPANVVPTGLLIAGIAFPLRAVRTWLPRIGLAIAVVALATTATLMRTEVAFLLPIARFTGMAWLIAAGFLASNSPATETE
ncbi:hypothetical protein [Nocardia sp. NPDC049707]|uniref:hypothetical protein n=1 Tax=Nocardia sp. NPDC049707 TaxID=3154735 RepID=UPI00342635DB